MNELRLNSVSEAILRASEVGPHERRRFLEAALGHDQQLLAEALHALGLDSETGDTQVHDRSVHAEPERDWSREIIGPWKLLHRLGGGGMGEVYLAERQGADFTQRVAIKLVRTDLAGPGLASRLKAERQILGRLRHPNIALLLDGGTTDDGVPYLVMEYVDGLPIDVYCDQHRLTLRERLTLFRQVCTAVHVAHQNLIVHRDLKPSNILVTADGTPKLLDFGIAKLLEPGPVLHTLAMTAVGVRLMTPDYASPEQVYGEAITTASDVYVLGVLLYELLAGCKPLKFDKTGMSDIERTVRGTTIPAPSSAVSSIARRTHQLAANAAAARRTNPRKLRHELAGDIDNIVLMAMRKEPARRYSSAEQLSADIGRYLAGNPLIARPDSWSYRTKKFIGRHAAAVAFSIALVVLLAGALAATLAEGRRTERARVLAEQERHRSEEVASFLVRLFKVADPSESRGRQVTALELLEYGSHRIDELKSQPVTQASMMETIGSVYLELGMVNEARPHLENALKLRRLVLSREHPDIAQSLSSMGKLELAAGNLAVAETYFREALAMNQHLQGPTHLSVATSLEDLGQLLKVKGDLAQSSQMLEQSLQMMAALSRVPTARDTSVMNELAQVYEQKGDLDAAEALYRRALGINESLLGPDHPQVARSQHDLAIVLQAQGKLTEAEPLFRESLLTLRKVMGEKHPDTIDALGNYGRFLQQAGRFDEAETMLRQALALDKEVRGPTHMYVGYDLVNLGGLLFERGDDAAAEQAYREALGIYAKTLPAQHLYVASALTGLSRVLLRTKRYSDAEVATRRALEIRTALLPPTHPKVAEARALLEQSEGQGRVPEAASAVAHDAAVEARR